MTAKERVKKTIYFESPDRIPHFLPDGKENDMIFVKPWDEQGRFVASDRVTWTNEGSIDYRIDCWGLRWERSAGRKGDKGLARVPAITDITRQHEYEFPDCNPIEYFNRLKRAADENKCSKDPKYMLGGMGFYSIHQVTHDIRGLEDMFLDYYTNPEHLKKLIQRIAAKQKDSIKMVAEAGYDGIMGFDDWGMQTSLMISKELFQEFYLPCYKENWSYAHTLGLDVWLHSCGHILEILPDMITAGLNVIQMDQQENMGLELLGEQLHGKVAFWCPVDIQQTMNLGTNEQIIEYVKRMVQNLSSRKGGFISMSYANPEAINQTEEKLMVMSTAFRDYEFYHNK